MALLAGKLGTSSGLGGLGGRGPGSTSTFAQGYGSPTAGSGQGFIAETGEQVSSVMQGRVSLLALDSLILLLVVFYIWTHRVQGGG